MDEVVLSQPQKKAKRANFTWTESRELTLLNYVFKEKGYLRTDINFTDKFNAISRKITADQAFSGGQLDGAALKKKWDRIASTIDSKFSISAEGSNLSGLDEEPSEIEKLVLQMLKERFESAKAKEDQKVKERERNQKMLTHERNMIARQDKYSDFSSNTPSDEVSDCSDGSSKTTKKRSKCSPSETSASTAPKFDFEVEVLKALKEDPRLIEMELAERKQKLEDSVADKAQARDIEMMRAKAEERISIERAKADFERSKADQLVANTQLKLLEFLTKNTQN